MVKVIIITFGNTGIEKQRFYRCKNLVILKDEDIVKILISNKISSGNKNYKYFIAYLDDDYKIKLLHIMLPKPSAYIKTNDDET